MTSSSFYEQSSYYNYVVLRTSPDQFSFNANAMASVLPQPSQVFECHDSGVEVYYYENNSLDDVVEKAKRSWLEAGE
jgi:hypothetical protein